MSVSTTIKSIQDIMRKDAGVDGDAQRIGQLGWMLFLKIFDDQEQELELVKDNYHSPIPEEFRWSNWAADPEGITGDELQNFINNEMFPALKGLVQSTGGRNSRAIVVQSAFEDAYNYMKNGTLVRQVVNKLNEIDFNRSADRHTFNDIYEKILKDLQSAGNAGEFYTPRAVTQFMTDMVDPKLDEKVFDPACGTGGFLACAIEHVRSKYVSSVDDRRTLQNSFFGVEKKQLPHLLCTTNMLLHGIEVPSNVRHDNSLTRPLKDYGPADRVDVVLTNPPFGGQEEDGIEQNFPATFRTRETADLFLVLIMRLLKDRGRAAVVLPDSFLFGEGIKTRIKEKLLEECNLHTIVRLPNSVFRPYASVATNMLFFEKGISTKEIWFYEHHLPNEIAAYSKTNPIKTEYLNDCAAWWGGFDRLSRIENNSAWRISIDDIRKRNFNLDVKNPHEKASKIENAEILLRRLTDAENLYEDLRKNSKAHVNEVLSQSKYSAILDKYDQIVQSSDGRRLMKKAVLDAAIRGNFNSGLTDPDFSRNTLQRIEKKREHLRQKGVLRRKNRSSVSSDCEAPKVYQGCCTFERLENVAVLKKGLTGIKTAKPGPYPLVVTAESRLFCDHYDFEGSAVIIPLVSSTGHGHASIHRIHFQEGQFAVGTILCAVFSIDAASILPRFLYEYLSSFKDELLVSQMVGAANVSLTITKIGRVPIPIIPVAVQKKVGKIATLLDELEEHLKTKEELGNRLAEAVVAAA